MLEALPPADHERIIARLEVVPLKVGQILQTSGSHTKHVYFPTSGLLSVVLVLEDGSAAEVVSVGREGFTGLSAMVPGRQPLAEVHVAVLDASPACYRMPGDVFREEMARRDAFSNLIGLFSYAFLTGLMQGAVCNVRHGVEQRFAKWLLAALDRSGREDFSITHESMALVLGVRRPTVSKVAGVLQKAGVISYHRGRLKVLDRPGLEKSACECYRSSVSLWTQIRGWHSSGSVGSPNPTS